MRPASRTAGEVRLASAFPERERSITRAQVAGKRAQASAPSSTRESATMPSSSTVRYAGSVCVSVGAGTRLSSSRASTVVRSSAVSCTGKAAAAAPPASAATLSRAPAGTAAGRTRLNIEANTSNTTTVRYGFCSAGRRSSSRASGAALAGCTVSTTPLSSAQTQMPVLADPSACA